MLPHLTYKDRLTVLFCVVDDPSPTLRQALLILLPRPRDTISSGKRPGGRHPNLTAAETLTLALFHFWTNQRHWKAFYGLLAVGFRREFPALPTYETLLRQVNRQGPLGLSLLIALLGQRDNQGPLRCPFPWFASLDHMACARASAQGSVPSLHSGQALSISEGTVRGIGSLALSFTSCVTNEEGW